MSTGWLDDNGSRYFLNADGTMKTGWLQQMNQYYYLDENSGKMATGWKQLSGKWYFLQAVSYTHLDVYKRQQLDMDENLQERIRKYENGGF